MNADFSVHKEATVADTQTHTDRPKAAVMTATILPETAADVPRGSPNSSHAALAALGTIPDSEHVQVASSATIASACAIATVREDLLTPKGTHPKKKLSFAEDVSPKENSVRHLHSPKLILDVVHCPMQEYVALLQDKSETQEKPYLHKLRSILRELEAQAKSPNLTREELLDLKKRLNLLATQQPYDHSSGVANPRKMALPPYKYERDNDGLRVRTEIASLYKSIYSQLFSHIIKSKDLSILQNAEHFRFDELLAYATALGHVGLLAQAFGDFEQRVRNAFRHLLEQDKSIRIPHQKDPSKPKPNQQILAPLHFIREEGKEHFSSYLHLVEDLLALYDLECCEDLRRKNETMESWFMNGGDVLKRFDNHPDFLSSYAQSAGREYIVMQALCGRAKAQIDLYVRTIDYKDSDLLLTLCHYVNRFAMVHKLPDEFRSEIKKFVADVKANCEAKEVPLTQEMQDLLKEAESLSPRPSS